MLQKIALGKKKLNVMQGFKSAIFEKTVHLEVLLSFIFNTFNFAKSLINFVNLWVEIL